MNQLAYILASGLVISLVSMTGIAILKIHPRLSRSIERNLLLLGSLSGGIFLVTSILLIREAAEILPTSESLLAFGLGIAIYILLHKVLSPHRHLGADHHHSHNEKKVGWKILIGDTLHNIADGLLLVASFGASRAIGLATALSITLHEVPQEISEFLVLKKSGFSNREAVYRNFASSLSIFVGIALGLYFVQTETLQAYLLGVTATFFLGIVFTDLFPIRELLRSGQFFKNFLALSIGIICMISLRLFFGHSHIEHEDPITLSTGVIENHSS